MNLNKKIILGAVSTALIFQSVSFGNVSADEASTDDTTMFTVEFFDFDGNKIETLDVENGKAIDYSSIDTSKLDVHVDEYIEKRFKSWDVMPKTATENLKIYALSETAQLKLVSSPTRTEFYSKVGNISTNGLKVTITITTETSEFDDDGKRCTIKSVTDITESCKVTPQNLKQAFADSDTAVVMIFPIDTEIPILTYNISYFANLGDVNSDNMVNAVDASMVLTDYAVVSTGKPSELNENQLKCADTDANGTVNAIDASRILTYYANTSTGGSVEWEAMMN